jgi:hypothetical protein
MPLKDPINVKLVNNKPFPYDTLIAGIGTALSAAALAYTINANMGASRRENQHEVDKENLRIAVASTYLTLRSKYRKVFDRFWSDNGETTLSPSALSKTGFSNDDIREILLEPNHERRLLTLLNKIKEYQDTNRPLNAGWSGLSLLVDSDEEAAGDEERRNEEQRDERKYEAEQSRRRSREDEGEDEGEEEEDEEVARQRRVAKFNARRAANPIQLTAPRVLSAAELLPAAADPGSGYRNRKAKKSSKLAKSKIKKSKNLDAQILALLRA